jgi:hypothetical protein
MIVAAEPGDDKEHRQHTGDGQDDGDLEHGFRCGNSNLSQLEHKGKDSVGASRVADYAGCPNSFRLAEIIAAWDSPHYQSGEERKKGRALRLGPLEEFGLGSP